MQDKYGTSSRNTTDSAQNRHWVEYCPYADTRIADAVYGKVCTSRACFWSDADADVVTAQEMGMVKRLEWASSATGID